MAADKKAVMAILGASKPPPMDMGPTPDATADGDLAAVAGDILNAIDGKDAEALAAALQSFLDIAKG